MATSTIKENSQNKFILWRKKIGLGSQQTGTITFPASELQTIIGSRRLAGIATTVPISGYDFHLHRAEPLVPFPTNMVKIIYDIYPCAFHLYCNA